MAIPVRVNIALSILNRYHEREPESRTAKQTYLAAENLIRNIINGHEVLDAPPGPVEVQTPHPTGSALPPALAAALLGSASPALPGSLEPPEDGQNDIADEFVVTGLSSAEFDEVCKLLTKLRDQMPPQ